MATAQNEYATLVALIGFEQERSTMNPLAKDVTGNDREHPQPSSSPALLPDSPDPLAAARARRLAALQAAEGLWKDRTDIPKDGVTAQEQLRGEWH